MAAVGKLRSATVHVTVHRGRKVCPFIFQAPTAIKGGSFTLQRWQPVATITTPRRATEPASQTGGSAGNSDAIGRNAGPAIEAYKTGYAADAATRECATDQNSGCDGRSRRMAQVLTR
jgi:hypothetical protein